MIILTTCKYFLLKYRDSIHAGTRDKEDGRLHLEHTTLAVYILENSSQMSFQGMKNATSTRRIESAIPRQTDRGIFL